MNAIEFLTAVLGVDGKHLLDIGCGGGQLANALLEKGARVTGVDPAERAIMAARQAMPQARFDVATAEALPFPDSEFDGAIFLNSLHHIDGPRMRAALMEAGRVIVRGGGIAVIEPLAEGSFFDVFRLIDDETRVRREAQAALAAAEDEGDLRLVRTETFIRSELFATFDKFVERAMAAEPGRNSLISENRAAIEAAFLAHALCEPCGNFRLDQPLKADLYVVP